MVVFLCATVVFVALPYVAPGDALCVLVSVALCPWRYAGVCGSVPWRYAGGVSPPGVMRPCPVDLPRSLTRRVGFEPASSRRQVLEGIDTRIYRALVDPKMLREHLHEFPERYPAFL